MYTPFRNNSEYLDQFFNVIIRVPSFLLQCKIPVVGFFHAIVLTLFEPRGIHKYRII